MNDKGPTRDPGARRSPAARVTLATALLAVILFSSPGSVRSSPRGELEDFFGRVTTILSEATSAQQARAEVRGLAKALFDGHVAARDALGTEWDQLTSAERQKFTQTFTDVLEQAYLQMVAARLPRDRPPTIA